MLMLQQSYLQTNCGYPRNKWPVCQLSAYGAENASVMRNSAFSKTESQSTHLKGQLYVQLDPEHPEKCELNS